MVENIRQKIVGENIWWEIFSGKFVVENIWKKGVGPVDSGGRVDWEGTIFLTRPTEAPMPVYIIRLLTWPTEEEKFTVTSTIINQPSNIVQSAFGRWRGRYLQFCAKYSLCTIHDSFTHSQYNFCDKSHKDLSESRKHQKFIEIYSHQ